jgi:hypothetical protein
MHRNMNINKIADIFKTSMFVSAVEIITNTQARCTLQFPVSPTVPSLVYLYLFPIRLKML